MKTNEQAMERVNGGGGGSRQGEGRGKGRNEEEGDIMKEKRGIL